MPPAKIRQHDARKLPLSGSSIDLIITSPPYLNAIDYVRCSKFTLVWMGYRVSELQKLRSDNIGSEKGLGDEHGTDFRELLREIGADTFTTRHSGMLRRYASDLNLVMAEISRVLVPTGRAIFVVGDSTLRGTFIKNSEIITRLSAVHNLALRRRVSRELLPSRRYLPPPGTSNSAAALRERMRQEVILHFTSQKARKNEHSEPLRAVES